jgi:DNA recombination protein RmuC
VDALLIALLVGVVAVAAMLAGFVLGSRPVAALRTDAAEARERLAALEREHAVASEQARRAIQTEESLRDLTEQRNALDREVSALRPLRDQLAAQARELSAVRTEKETLAAAKAAFERGEEERARAFTQQLAQVKDLEAKLESRFTELAGKAVETAHDSFLKRASEKLDGERKEQQAKLQNLLQPVEATLKRYEEGLQRVEAERKDSYGELRGVLGELRKDNGQVRDETRKLVNALRSSPKARGRWGEQSLRNVLVQAGLTEGIDFEMEVSLETADGRLRPDVVVNLPSNRKLIIDAKCSLNAFLDACDEVDDEKKQACFKLHVASMRNHAQALGSKDYWAQFGEAADYVIMYIPGEHFLTAALEQDPQLWDWAFERRVLLATPTNLVAIARTVASVWRQEKITEQAEVIAALGKELHSRIATMAEHVVRMGRNLATANDAYNKMVGSFETQVFTQAKRFEPLGAGSSKEIASPPLVEVAPRPLTKLSPPPANDELTAAE